MLSESTPQSALERPSMTDAHSGDATDDQDAEEIHRRLRSLPPEVGAVLVAVGLIELILPLPLGLPFLLAGGLILAPSYFYRLERWVTTRFPRIHRAARRQLDRFIDDFEKRYPQSQTDHP
jgi:hypothetical protein